MLLKSLVKKRFSEVKHQIVLVRHGQSIWNKQKRWAGWTDVPLSQFGIQQVKQCARLLKSRGQNFDVVYTSVLKRAKNTAQILIEQLTLKDAIVFHDWRLNQKHYGVLQGLSKPEIAEKYGADLVNQWRRSLTVAPPPLRKQDKNHPAHDPLYKQINPEELPSSECLNDISKRVKNLWDQKIRAEVVRNKKVLIVGHGSSLRAILQNMNKKEEIQVVNWNIPNSVPVILKLDQHLNLLNLQYFGNLKQIQEKMKKVKMQTERTKL